MMESTGLFLRKSQVHAGMTVALCLEGKETPEVDEKGDPLVLKALVSGIEHLEVRFYPLRGGIRFPEGGEGRVITANGMKGFKPNIRFMPTQVFSPRNAPPNTEFVVFVNGEVLCHEPAKSWGKNRVYILTDDQGRCCSNNRYEYSWWQREFPLPEDAVLVPISEIGQGDRRGAKRQKVLV